MFAPGRSGYVSSALTSVLAALLFCVASTAWGASVCYDETFYPSVATLQKTPDGIRAVLGGKEDDRAYPRRERRALTYTDGRGWQRDAPFRCSEKDCRSPDTRAPISPPSLSKPEAVALRPELRNAEHIEQKIGAWIQQGGVIWFGISFYSGEGYDGVGGVGRHDQTTGSTVVRRPAGIRDSPIDRIVHDGRWLWLGTSGHHECLGKPPTHGLVRYDWDADRLETFEGRDAGPCGFIVKDLLLDPRYLWVATDLGLSRWDRRAKKWDHYVPDRPADPPMRPATCEALYTSLLKVLPRKTEDLGDFRSYYSQLFQPLKHFRPRFLGSYVKTLRPEDWSCDDLEFLAERASDYEALKANVLRFRPIGTADALCALKGFGKRKTREPEWRDVLLATLDTSPRHEQVEILDLLTPFAGDGKVGGVLLHRLRTTPYPSREAELLPGILGDKSVPALVEALDRFKEGDQIVDRIVVSGIIIGLMRATRVAISADGAVAKIPAGVDPEVLCDVIECPLDRDGLLRVTGHWKTWWEAHKGEYGVAR